MSLFGYLHFPGFFFDFPLSLRQCDVTKRDLLFVFTLLRRRPISLFIRHLYPVFPGYAADVQKISIEDPFFLAEMPAQLLDQLVLRFLPSRFPTALWAQMFLSSCH